MASAMVLGIFLVIAVVVAIIFVISLISLLDYVPKGNRHCTSCDFYVAKKGCANPNYATIQKHPLGDRVRKHGNVLKLNKNLDCKEFYQNTDSGCI